MTPSVSEVINANTQRSSIYADKQFEKMTVEDRERIVVDLVHYLLTADYRKQPIKYSDIRKHALRGEHSRSFSSLMKIANERLRYVYGITIIETEVGKQKACMLINMLDNKYDAAHQAWAPEEDIHIGLVMIILSAIFMKGNVLNEEDLNELLTRLGIALGRPDETFGDVKHLIHTNFVRQGYIEVQREPGADPPVHTYRWGQRAKVETSKRHAMDFICQVFDDIPERWAAQMHDIKQSQAAESAAASESEGPSCSRSA